MCETYRIPHSHFLGGPPVWKQSDRDKAIWHQVHKAQICKGCGTHPDDWDPSKGGERHAYVGDVSRCAGCAALEQKREEFDSAPKGEFGRGSQVVLRRRPGGAS